MVGARRRTHHKSRFGCRNCKNRKVKCDETKPACLNCKKRQEQCDFLIIDSPEPTLSASGLNMADLELLHNYTCITYRTLSENATIREFYRTTVVQIGFSCDYIMRSILAVSSLHLAHHRPHMLDHHQSLAIVHHQAASRAALPLIPDVTSESGQTLFLFSVLTTYYALGLPRKSDNGLLLGDAGFPEWVYLLRGTKGFIDVAGIPSDGPLAPLFQHSIARFMLRESPEASNSPAHLPLTELEEVVAHRSRDDSHLGEIYSCSLVELKKSFGQAWAHSTSPYEMTDAFIWVYLVAEDLLPLLRVPTQESVAIFAFFCVLLRRLDGHWWMQGWPQQLIARAYDLLDEEGRLWIHWAVEEMGWVPPPATERL
ncbi:hypothetical protein GQ53DRAFT_692208 [Thozetella sp. PMI_491]|nr:hypothetical protein GQ53DRAFT_692208 [Thozetella sp. PMI_491]